MRFVALWMDVQSPKDILSILREGADVVLVFYTNGHFCSRQPRLRVRALREKFLHIMGSYRSTGVPDAGLWWLQPPFCYTIAAAVAIVIVFKVSARVKVLTKRGAKAEILLLLHTAHGDKSSTRSR